MHSTKKRERGKQDAPAEGDGADWVVKWLGDARLYKPWPAINDNDLGACECAQAFGPAKAAIPAHLNTAKGQVLAVKDISIESTPRCNGKPTSAVKARFVKELK